jgi:prophage DNA circulation protein
MKKLLVVVLVLIVAIGAVGYWRDWFNLTQVHPDKFKHDREDFSKTVVDKAKAVKDQVASLWNKSEGMTGDDKAELGELKEKHDRLEQQIKQLDEVGQDRFESIKQDLSKNLEDVETKIAALTKKVDKAKDKQK